MRNNLKGIFSVLIAFVTMLIFFTSCERGDVIEEETSLKESTIQVNKITKEQMLSKYELKRSLSEITSKSKNQLLSVYDSVNQLFIDDTYASQIISGDYESYNIPAYKINQDSTVLYNVFLEKQLDGTFESIC
ncbi:hypothetical protein [Nonlabens sp.]|uniref:hypothetical protein n=1 Tax=Nonlabens sp. TaxID=1888209 RepID=UPI001BCE2CC3|nr:hypothetical protein [Nonlabens sp.]